MGWTYNHRYKGTSIEQHLIDSGVFKWNADSPFEYTVLKTSVVKLTTLYAAIEKKNKETGERKVFAAVILIQMIKGQQYENFGYKDMDETCGPCSYDCPKSILQLLTPTDSQYANDWREQCWNKINERKSAPKIKVGNVFNFAKNIKFSNGREFSSLVVGEVCRGGRYVMKSLQDDCDYILTRAIVMRHLANNNLAIEASAP